MKTYRLTRRQLLQLDLETVFAFFADAANLEQITPPWLHFEVTTPVPIDMRAGTRIDYRLRLHGVPVRWQSEIAVWQPPVRFVDRQVRGPYRLWVHTHDFEATDDGTLVTDSVDYAVHGNAAVERFLVRPDLRRIFDYRARRLAAWERTNREIAACAVPSGATRSRPSAQTQAIEDLAVQGLAAAVLSERDFIVLRRIVEGLADEEIAKEIGISGLTIDENVQTILRFTGATSRTGAAVHAIKRGLLD